jgi:hypothetical protein
MNGPCARPSQPSGFPLSRRSSLLKPVYGRPSQACRRSRADHGATEVAGEPIPLSGLTARPESADSPSCRQHEAHNARASNQREGVGAQDFRGEVQIHAAGSTGTLDQLADCLARPDFSEGMPGCLHDAGCPNLDKASQNRAMQGMKQCWRTEVNTITGKSLD